MIFAGITLPMRIRERREFYMKNNTLTPQTLPKNTKFPVWISYLTTTKNRDLKSNYLQPYLPFCTILSKGSMSLCLNTLLRSYTPSHKLRVNSIFP